MSDQAPEQVPPRPPAGPSYANSPFKFVFWGIVVLVLLSLPFARLVTLLPPWNTWHAGCFPPLMARSVAMLFPVTALAIIYVAIVATLVYRDASRRGMDPWLWATVATFLPFFIGVFLYLVMRTNGRRTCPKCGKALQADFKACPYCGHVEELVCSQCQTPIAAGWKFCAKCGHPLA